MSYGIIFWEILLIPLEFLDCKILHQKYFPSKKKGDLQKKYLKKNILTPYHHYIFINVHVLSKKTIKNYLADTRPITRFILGSIGIRVRKNVPNAKKNPLEVHQTVRQAVQTVGSPENLSRRVWLAFKFCGPKKLNSH
ncbi:hypothetical protein NQ317_004387 [Molorchus minor]|uniref:Uncharacterized protein n=1 Tax=Molorchus minor TaxID=1323400 RepID=A0ABQ9J8A2_9CUCU|nr:hypothetical protein NQ317_004387 [Molorchus minor]